VRRDLEWLLNTRRIAVPPDESLKEVNRSVYVYGLPDFTALALNLPRTRPSWCAFLHSTLKLFEPRLAT
jgi:type VI secretion system protein ImpF